MPIMNSTFFTAGNMEKLRQIMSIHKFAQGVYVFQEQDESDSIYYLQSGQVKVCKISEEGKEHVLSIYHTGDLFGQLDPYQDSKHSCTAVATEPCEIGIIPKQDLELLIWQHGELGIEFVNWMGYMQRLTQTKFRDLMMYGKTGALSSTLIRLSNTYGLMEKDGIHITLKLTNSELADYICCTRESVNRMLATFKKDGAIAINDGNIVITDLKYLQNICKCEQCPAELCRV